jgi:methylase of polypeptide subunit release factors
MTLQHANAHSECVREKLLREAARLGITTVDIERAFYGHAAVSSMTALPPAPATAATAITTGKHCCDNAHCNDVAPIVMMLCYCYGYYHCYCCCCRYW